MLEYKLKGYHVLLYSFEGSPKHKDYGILPLGFHQLLTLWPGSTSVSTACACHKTAV